MFQSVGPLSAHMALHIVFMNAVAPVVAWMLVGLARRAGLERWAVMATVLQLALIWGWHSPPVLPAAMQSHLLHFAMQFSLFGGALFFWLAVFAIAGDARWRAILLLLVTGKLFCLLGVLLVFAPRVLFPAGIASLADQQLAGLLMVVACPASYVTAGVVISARWFADMDRPGEEPRMRAARDAA